MPDSLGLLGRIGNSQPAAEQEILGCDGSVRLQSWTQKPAGSCRESSGLYAALEG